MHHLALRWIVVAAPLFGGLAAAQPFDEPPARYRSEANPTEPLRAAPAFSPHDPSTETADISSTHLDNNAPISSPHSQDDVEAASFEQHSHDPALPKLTPRPPTLLVQQRDAAPGAVRAANYNATTFLTVGASLATVLGLFFLAAWLMRRGMPRGGGSLPTGVLEVLGRAPLPHRQQMQLMRCGNKLILVAISTTGVETLTEITDPVEVDRVMGLCSSTKSNSHTASFRQVLDQYGREAHAPGFVDNQFAAQDVERSVPRSRQGGRP